VVEPAKKRVRIGDLLVAHSYITQEQLEQALAQQKNTGLKLGRQVIEMGMVEENALLGLLSQLLDIPFIELRQFHFDKDLVQSLPEAIARRYRVIVLSESADSVLLGMADPTDIFGLDDIQKYFTKPVKQAVIRESELLDIFDIAYSHADEIAGLAEELEEELSADTIDIGNIVTDSSEDDAPVVRLLQKIFEEALGNKASDIHMEPDETVLRIRQRIDGSLVEQVMNEKRIAPALVVRLKLMANLDISEKRLPQDGRFNLRLGRKNVDIRVSTMPVQHGESVVMRILDQSEGVRPLEAVGMPDNYIARFRKVIRRPFGLILVTGPTGSGKTTTLYGALSELNTADKKIITVEDPVEYRLPRINQVQIHDRIGLTFSSVLKATLRQDPDVLLIGEIRDAESAEIALRAAMTGHLVLSTLHTNDAVTSALRLIDMGVDPYLVASSLKAIVAQRLVRKICETCSQDYTLTEGERALFDRIKPKNHSDAHFKTGKGCPHCFGSGYRGRVGVFELLEINAPMADALRDNSVRNFHDAAHANDSFRALGASALDLAMAGIISFSEVLRVSAELADESLSEIEGA
jgi:MSHA biogenesis protein MshE